MTKKSTEAKRDDVQIRLDAIIRLMIEVGKGKEPMTDSIAARALNSVGLTPTEIARILGKKSATDVSPYLYKKSQRT